MFRDRHSPAWLRLRVAPWTHQRYHRRASREIVPIPHCSTVTRTRARDIRPRLAPRDPTSRETIGVSRAIWSRTRKGYRHFVNETCFFALPTRGSPVMQRARHLDLYLRLSSPPISSCQSEKPSRRGSGLAGRSRGKGGREDARIALPQAAQSAHGVRARARTPEKRPLKET